MVLGYPCLGQLLPQLTDKVAELFVLLQTCPPQLPKGAKATKMQLKRLKTHGLKHFQNRIRFGVVADKGQGEMKIFRRCVIAADT